MTGIRYDAVLKDLFERDRPSLLHELTGGIPIQAFLNVEIPKIIDRRVDSVAKLANGTICHIEFQSQNHRRMPYRQGIYALLIADKFQTKVEQTVIYTGQAPLRMRDSIDAGSVRVRFKLLDIREYSALALAHSANPADRALAILGSGSSEHLREVLEAAVALTPLERDRALTQLGMLSSLRGLSKRVTMELESMSNFATIENNEFVKLMHRAKIEGKAEGKREGRMEAKVEVLTLLLTARFNPLPSWATERLRSATQAQVDRWISKAATAPTLEGVIGRRR